MSDNLTPEQREIARIAAHRDENSYLPPERLAAHLMNEVLVLRDRIEELERERDRLKHINAAHCETVSAYIIDNARQEEGRKAAEAEVTRLSALLREAGDALTWAQTHLDSVGLHSTAVDEAVARLQEPRT